MGWLSRIRRQSALALVGCAMTGCALAVAPADWQRWDFGAFQLRTPAGMQLAAGGIDSQAGALSAGDLRIEYDFGLYSDPLTRRDDTWDYQSRSGSVDGLTARFVRFRLGATPGQTARMCSGVHVPGVRESGMGALALTVLACAARDDSLKVVPAVLASIRFAQPAAR